jgi:hypothetical protein
LQSIFAMSPKCFIFGNRIFVTLMGNGSISLAHNAVMPFRCPASGKPPIPSNRLPIVISVFLASFSFASCTLPVLRLFPSGSGRCYAIVNVQYGAVIVPPDGERFMSGCLPFIPIDTLRLCQLRGLRSGLPKTHTPFSFF